MVLAALAQPGHTEEAADEPSIIVVPAECIAYWSVPGAAATPAQWNASLSFAACIQDGSRRRLDRVESLPAFVEQLQAEMAPSMVFYVTAIEEAPEDVKLRASYMIGLGQVALMTRARASATAPELRDELDELLDPHAKLAYFIFRTIDRFAIEHPDVVHDAVLRHVVQSSRDLAAALETRWEAPEDGLPSIASSPGALP